MGADGGSIPDRRDLVRTKGKGEQTDKALLRELYFLCALSKRPLVRPVVLDPLGKLYNRDAVLEFLLDKGKYGDGDVICGYLKGVKDLLTLNLTPNPEYSNQDLSTTSTLPSRAPFVCPLSLREMSGSVPFIALRPCGCVFSDAAVRAVIPSLARPPTPGPSEIHDKAKPVGSAQSNAEQDASRDSVACPNCGKEIKPTEATSVMPINPSKEVQEVLLEQLLVARATTKAGRKRKIEAVTAVDDRADTGAGLLEVPAPIRNGSGTASPGPTAAPPSKSARLGHTSASASPASPSVKVKAARPTIEPSPSTSIPNSGRQSVAQKLAEQEQKRLAAQAGMSDAVKSMFRPKNAEAAKTGGAADFFGRTFNRYA